MSRFWIILLRIALIGLPILMYFHWIKLVKAGHPHARRWFWLMITCIVLLGIGLVSFIVLDGQPRGSHYHPATMENGRIVPGRMD
ncbi:MAG: hypothetical protein FGM23_03495 [Alphaproteobacteria bacterium]|nr:hypothetical protein [Alphaproteobacteria bacterium]